MTAADPHLATYLNDHLAGAATALEVLDALSKHQDPELLQAVRALHVAIAADRDRLLDAMRSAQIAVSTTRQAAGWLGERMAAAKVRLDDPLDRGLRTFELLELVALGIDGKRALWAGLRACRLSSLSLTDADFAALAARADEQRSAIEPHRLRYAMKALRQSAA
jgi:hypothetical protein